MRIPESLATLAEYGIIDEVVRPLMSGKEAQIYLVRAQGEARVAKIYKEAQNRSFQHRVDYTEGRKVRNTRDQRAIQSRSKHGRAQDEAAWRGTEVSMIYRLHAAGVRVPVPYHFVDGVLVMELVEGPDGEPAPRLGDLRYAEAEAQAHYAQILGQVVRMLCAGVVHGDLSEFNVLLGRDGPVVIDFPQSVDPAHNPNARKLLVRDVDNLHRFLQRHVRGAPRRPYAEEMWALYEANLLTPETVLTGVYRPSHKAADTAGVLSLIQDASRDERRRREALGIGLGRALSGVPARPERGPRTPRPPVSSPRQPAVPVRPAAPTARPSPPQQRASVAMAGAAVSSTSSSVAAVPTTTPQPPGALGPSGAARRRRRRRRGGRGGAGGPPPSVPPANG